MSGSLICSILTSTVVLAEKLQKETFPQLILMIQMTFAVGTILSMLFPSYSNSIRACEIIGYTIYSLWIVRCSESNADILHSYTLSAVYH
jgi:hypothetical protein